MSETQSGSSIAGRWEIVSVEGFDENELRVETGPFIEFQAGGNGAFHFGYIRGSLEYRVEHEDDRPVAQFTFDAHCGAEPMSGSGSAAMVGPELEGVICLYTGEVSRFVARQTP